jgi:hypothetical protein
MHTRPFAHSAILCAALILSVFILCTHIALADSRDTSDRMARDTRTALQDNFCTRLSQLASDHPFIFLPLSVFCGVSVDISAFPQSITLGQSSLLTWHSENADSCTASGAWSGDVTTSGSMMVFPTGLSNNYVLDCEGPGGHMQATTTVFIAPAQLN